VRARARSLRNARVRVRQWWEARRGVARSPRRTLEPARIRRQKLLEVWKGCFDAPAGLHVVLPGLKGHHAYIFNIKERLKEKGFQWNPDKRLWWREAPFGINDKTVE
jgi:hypothetical protein